MDIEVRTRHAGKTYQFNEGHDPRQPAQYWFQNPPEGLTLFIVLYTQACRWSRCLGCNLSSRVSARHVPFGDIMGQIDHLFLQLLTQQHRVDLRKIILSNNGSVLDEETFSTTALIYFVAMMNLHCPNLSTVSIETRPEYIEWEELEVLARALKEGNTPTDLELAVGFEAFDDRIRNDYFRKGLALDTFEHMVKMVAEYDFKLKVYFMQKPVPNITEEEGIRDIMQAIDYLNALAKRFDIDINMHLNPTYVAKGTELERAFLAGEYNPPRMESVMRAVRHAEHAGISVYVGMDDEGLAVEGGSFIRSGDEYIVRKLEEFNRTQDYNLLR